MSAIVIFVLIAFSLKSSLASSNEYPNKFHSIYGCKQINVANSYYHPVTYIPIKSFENTGVGVNSTFFRIGVLGRSDAIIRFSKVPMPYNNNIVHEISIGGGLNHLTEIRRQTRYNVLLFNNHVIKSLQTSDVLSDMAPFVMQVEFVNGGAVRLIRDGEKEPFMEFSDPEAEINFKYIGFSSWLSNMVYFFDCPVFSFDVRFNKFNI